ncbi:hypothetical protein HNI00_10440 [Thermoleptolyngbya oregonensis NK1-22]|uniref:Uncharacterized protein n=1 Tax=Thermoleptolyngbya oregonensis NK1-22 TaxID=2547457 RepID=A0AA96Y4X7_9CYAN|nr:hypothetical protein [Thermoleptolyngbya oregonensis]WOB43529.1 hypothetical protein HNI00_10440 [Thermoleptolyngbya oregonensis NK1-22]
MSSILISILIPGFAHRISFSNCTNPHQNSADVSEGWLEAPQLVGFVVPGFLTSFCK